MPIVALQYLSSYTFELFNALSPFFYKDRRTQYLRTFAIVRVTTVDNNKQRGYPILQFSQDIQFICIRQIRINYEEVEKIRPKGPFQYLATVSGKLDPVPFRRHLPF